MKVYLVIEEHIFNGSDSGCNVAVWGDRKSAVEDFLKSEKRAKEAIGEGATCELASRDDITNSLCDRLSSSIYEDGFYNETHFDVTMQRVDVGGNLEFDTLERITLNKEYELECTQEDVLSAIKERDNAKDICFTDDEVARIAKMAQNNLGKCEMYYEAYWDMINHAIDDFLNESEGK